MACDTGMNDPSSAVPPPSITLAVNVDAPAVASLTRSMMGYVMVSSVPKYLQDCAPKMTKHVAAADTDMIRIIVTRTKDTNKIATTVIIIFVVLLSTCTTYGD